ncbi:MAG: CrcB family protein [Mesorhizobium sp.]|nr:CrcB family protein [Mesorhizobium sp.]
MSLWVANIVLVALGGALGGMGRLWVSGRVERIAGESFPWGILVVNVSGAACIGVVGGLLLSRDTHSAGAFQLWAVLVIGLLGSYTTVSSFSLQTLALLRAGDFPRAALNVVASLVLCLSAAAAGYAAALTLTPGA